MYWLGLLLLCVGGLGASPNPPPYVQSRQIFTDAKLYLDQNLPPENRNFENAEARLNYAFGLLTSTLGYIAADLAQNGSNVDQLTDFTHILPLAWEDYNSHADLTKNTLTEALTRTTLLRNLITTECMLVHSITECNQRVDDKVKTDVDLKKQAKLLLKLGAASNLLMNMKEHFNSLRTNFEVVPYLLHNLLGKDLQKLLGAARDALLVLQENRLPTY